MTDLLQQIDEGIARHQPKKVSGFCAACSLVDTLFRWPCETLKALQMAREGLKFKAYTHERLDGLGVPTVVPSPHTDAGCRVGGRFDWIEAKLQEAVVERERLKGCLERANANMEEAERSLYLKLDAIEGDFCKCYDLATIASSYWPELSGSWVGTVSERLQRTLSAEHDAREAAEAKLKDAEEKMRGLVEALEQVIAEVEYLSHRAARNISMIAREALTQAKREGE